MSPAMGAENLVTHGPLEALARDAAVGPGDVVALLDPNGERREPDLDRVLKTILFTDIVGSTQRAAELGDRRWRDLLDRHDTMVRHALARFRGDAIKATGDGFLAAFDGPARAIRCA